MRAKGYTFHGTDCAYGRVGWCAAPDSCRQQYVYQHWCTGNAETEALLATVGGYEALATMSQRERLANPIWARLAASSRRPSLPCETQLPTEVTGWAGPAHGSCEWNGYTTPATRARNQRIRQAATATARAHGTTTGAHGDDATG